MIDVTQYSARFGNVRGGLTGLPKWARFIVAVFAIPGIVLLGLSILAIVVSIVTLLLLTVPVYSLLARLTAGRGSGQMSENQSPSDVFRPTGGVRRVDATVIE